MRALKKPTVELCCVLFCRTEKSSPIIRRVNKYYLNPVRSFQCLFGLKLGWGWLIKCSGGRCEGSVKLRFLIRGGIPEPEYSRHQTVLPLWRPNAGMWFSRRYGGTLGLLGGKVHRGRRWRGGGVSPGNLETEAVYMWSFVEGSGDAKKHSRRSELLEFQTDAATSVTQKFPF